MKLIYPEKQGPPGATSENGNYPVGNLINNVREKVWQAAAGVQAATLTVPITTGSAIALFNTNAETAEITITLDADASTIKTETITLETTARTYKNLWLDYPVQTAAHTATILLTAASGETVEAGIVRAGDVISLRTPINPKEGKKDYSIRKELNNGGFYGRLRAIVRTYRFSAKLTRTTQFFDLSEVYDNVGQVTPLAWLLVENVNDLQWTVFARFDGVISGSHDHPTRTPTSVSLLEVV